jgi:hypothetical protein
MSTPAEGLTPEIQGHDLPLALLTRRSLHRNDVCYSGARSFSDCNEHASEVEAITMTAKAGHNAVTDRTEPGPLQNGAADEVTCWIIRGGASMVTGKPGTSSKLGMLRSHIL